MIRKIFKALKITAVAVPLGCFSMTATAALILDNTDYSRADFLLTGSHNGPYAGQTISFGQLQATTAGQIQFEYLYKEAGYTNSLVLTFGSGGTIFSTSSASGGTLSGWFDVATGALQFGVCTSGGTSFTTYGRCADNSDPASLVAQDNGVGYRGIGFLQESPTSWVMFWDDSGANNDDDFDDLVARVRFVPVPEPGTLTLLGLGLLGFGLMRRRT